MRRSGGRPILGAVSGLLLGVFLFLILIVYAGVAINSTVVFVVLLAGGLVLGLALGITGPLGRRRGRAPTAVVTQTPDPTS